MIDKESSIPLHKQAEFYLRRLIEMDKYKNGKMIPNEIELSRQMNISRNTLRQAINKLVHEGLLIRKRGIGTYVAMGKFSSEATNWLSFSQEMRLLGIEVENFELHIYRQRPTNEAKLFFNINDDETKVLRIERLRGKVDFPFVYFASEFNPEIPLTGNENFNLPLYDILRDEFNIIVKSSREEISAVPAGQFLAEKLDMELGEPVLVRKRLVSDIEGRPVEYNIGWYRGDSFTYKIECNRKEDYQSP